MITVDEFIKEYEKTDNKTEFCKQHIKNEYVPYSKKMDKCHQIIKGGCYKKVGDDEVFYINSPAIKMLFEILLIQLYTDIVIKDPVGDFEKIDECGVFDTRSLLDILNANYPKREVENLYDLLWDMVDDAEKNTHHIVSYLDTWVRSLNISLDSLMELAGGEDNDK